MVTMNTLLGSFGSFGSYPSARHASLPHAVPPIPEKL